MKKRITALLMVLGLTAALCSTAMADTTETFSTENETFPGDTEIEIGATYETTAGIDGGEVYSVTLSWDDIDELVYQAASAGTYVWNTSTHVYELEEDSSASGAWDTTSTDISISVTNDSNAAVTVSGTYTDTSDSVESSGTFTSVSLETAAQDDDGEFEYYETGREGTAQTGTLTGTVSVTSGIIDADTTIGTLTLTVAVSE